MSEPQFVGAGGFMGQQEQQPNSDGFVSPIEHFDQKRKKNKNVKKDELGTNFVHPVKHFDDFGHKEFALARPDLVIAGASLKRPGWNIFLMFFGVLLPLAATVVECTSHVCAQTFFDPLPSTNHIILFSMIPLSNFLYWLALRKDMSEHFGMMALTSGMAMGVAILYSIMFMPIVPIGLIGILFAGLGLCALAPLFALLSTWLAGRGIVRLSEQHDTHFDAHQAKHLGHLLILTTVIAIECPSTVTRIVLSNALDPRTEISLPAIKWLRAFGNQEVMLRACYEHGGRATDIIGSLYDSTHPTSVDQARQLFFKVTGKPFNTVPIPKSARATIRDQFFDDYDPLNAGVTDEFDLDPDIAGEMVAGFSRGVSVKESTMDAKLYPDAAISLVEWSFSFANSSGLDREGRANILLPHGSVVCGADIIVDGQLHHASVMEKSAARNLYVNNVKAHRDPLLVSMAGEDQVLVQCYPLNPKSKVGVTLNIVSPMQVASDYKTATLCLPAFSERNFLVDEPLNVTVQTLDSISNAPVAAAKSEKIDANRLTQFVTYAAQRNPKIRSISFPPDADQETVNSTSSRALQNTILVRLNRDHRAWLSASATKPSLKQDQVVLPLRDSLGKAPSNLKVVIDGSAGMDRYLPRIAAGLAELPKGLPVSIIFVGDEVKNLAHSSQAGSTEFRQALEQLKKMDCGGGQVDSDVVGIARATMEPHSSILWIHGGQPLLYANESYPNDRAKDGARPDIYDLQTVAGPDMVRQKTFNEQTLLRVPNSGDITADIAGLIDRWKIDGGTYRSSPESTLTLSSAPMFLWDKIFAADQVRALTSLNIDSGDADSKTKAKASTQSVNAATFTALNHEIVTSCSSLVVSDPTILKETFVELNPPNAKSPSANIMDALTKNLQSVGIKKDEAIKPATLQNASLASQPQLKTKPVRQGAKRSSSGGANAKQIEADNGAAYQKADAAVKPKKGLLDTSQLMASMPFGAPTPEPDTNLLIAAVGILFAGALVLRKRVKLKT